MGIIYYTHSVHGRRKPKILLDDYVYTRHCENVDKTRWRCTNCNKKCSAILYTSGKTVRTRHPHNHEPPNRNPLDNWVPQEVFIIKEYSKKSITDISIHDYGLGPSFLNNLNKDREGGK